MPCSQYWTTQRSLKPIGYRDQLCPSKSGLLYLVSICFGKFLSLLSSYHHWYLLIYSSTICFHVSYDMFPLIYMSVRWNGMQMSNSIDQLLPLLLKGLSNSFGGSCWFIYLHLFMSKSQPQKTMLQRRRSAVVGVLLSGLGWIAADLWSPQSSIYFSSFMK